MALYHRLKRQFFSRIQIVRAVLIVLFVLFIGATTFFGYRLSRTLSYAALPEHHNRTNFLLLGMGGGVHDGPDLTDTILFVSLSRSSAPIIISIPRDIWVASLRAKINTAYHYGFAKAGSSGGLTLAKSAVSEVINQPVDFAVALDFSTFVNVVNAVGGIDVQVNHSFTDSQYPIDGQENNPCDSCRYQTITFVAGPQHMDGATALKFVRSRHSEDPQEGTDFARSARQEKVLSAFKTRLISHPGFIKPVFTLLSKNVVTDLDSKYYFSLATLAFSARDRSIVSQSVSDQFYNPPLSDQYDNQWILLSKDDHPQIVFDYVSNLLGK